MAFTTQIARTNFTDVVITITTEEDLERLIHVIDFAVKQLPLYWDNVEVEKQFMNLSMQLARGLTK